MAGRIPMVWPSMDTTRISQRFGQQLSVYNTTPHTGLDIAAALGTMVIAAAAGKVITAQYNFYGYGHCIRIDHGNGIHTLYAHLNKILVKEGQEVTLGQVIALVGMSGGVTGPHLHFEVRTDCAVSYTSGLPGTCQNPEQWVAPEIYSGQLIPAGGLNTADASYTQRLTAPYKDNKYYINVSYGGYNTCQTGNPAGSKPSAGSVLPNSIGYAVGRFNEIGNYQTTKYFNGVETANDFINKAKEQNLQVSQSPSLGACAVWSQSGGPGHVAILENITIVNGVKVIVTSESAWGGEAFFITKRPAGGNWGQDSSYKFLGFINNPGVSYKVGYNSSSDAQNEEVSTIDTSSIRDKIKSALNKAVNDNSLDSAARESYTIEVVNNKLGSVSKLRGMNLLTMPTLVESPFIEAKIGEYTFGSYSKVSNTTSNSNITSRKVTYPNFMDSLEITKVNGAVNQYMLHMKYQIQAGQDPNLIDKVLSTVSNSRKIYLTYGDWSSPSFIYRNEEALITKVNSAVDFAHSCITYTLYCTSAALSLRSKTYDFGSRFAKPSTVILELLRNSSYGLLDIFYGFKNKPDAMYRMIATDDKEVSIKAHNHVDILTYLNYLVSCMLSNSNGNSTIQNSVYSLIIKDDIGSELEGPYFQVIRTNSTNKSITSSNVYEVDVGFPGDTLVTQFSLMNDNSWSILYNYNDSVSLDNYVYKIDNKGNMYTEASPNITTSDIYKETTAANKTWWTRMTQFPITATLQVKGLLRPAMLMEYVKVNAYFYGQRHISSGLYVITKQQDKLDSSGYRTTLSLLRIAGDEDELYSISQTITKNESPSSGRGTTFYGNGNNSGFTGGYIGNNAKRQQMVK